MLTSIRKVLTLLERFTFETPEWSLAELAATLRIPKPTVHHMVATLMESGWVAQDPKTRRYRLGMRWWEKGWVAVHHLGLREAARPFVEALAEETRETVHLAILDPADPAYAIYIDKIESEQAVRAYSTTGGRVLSHCVATGKAILAFNPDVVKRLLRAPIRRFTPATLTGAESLTREMRATQRRGYSVSLGEYRSDVFGAAAPIRDHEGRVFAAVGVSAPAYRLPRRVIDQTAPAVMRAAHRISLQMGHVDGGGLAHPRRLSRVPRS